MLDNIYFDKKQLDSIKKACYKNIILQLFLFMLFKNERKRAIMRPKYFLVIISVVTSNLIVGSSVVYSGCPLRRTPVVGPYNSPFQNNNAYDNMATSSPLPGEAGFIGPLLPSQSYGAEFDFEGFDGFFTFEDLGGVRPPVGGENTTPEYLKAQSEVVNAQQNVKKAETKANEAKNQVDDATITLNNKKTELNKQTDLKNNLDSRLSNLKDDLGRLMHDEEKFQDDPEAHKAWAENCANLQNMINNLQNQFQALRENIPRLNQQVTEADKHLKNAQTTYDNAAQNLKDANQGLQNAVAAEAAAQQAAKEAAIQKQIDESVARDQAFAAATQNKDKVWEQALNETTTKSDTGKNDKVDQGSEVGSTGDVSASSNLGSDQNKEPDTSVPQITGNNYTMDLELQKESSFVLWTKDLSADQVNDAVQAEILKLAATSSTYVEGSNQAIEGLKWNIKGEKAQESTSAVASAVIEGTLSSGLNGLKNAGEAGEAIADTIESALDTYNDIQDKMDTAAEVIDLINDKLKDKGWTVTTNVWNNHSQTVTSTTYYNSATGDYITNIATVPVKQGETLTTGRDPSAGERTGREASATISGKVKAINPGIFDRIF